MPTDAFAVLLKKLGNCLDPEVLAATVDHWAPRLGSNLDAKTPVIADVSYGNDARHRLDLFPVKVHGAPVVLFIHGGGFVAGAKRVASPFYANVGRYFAAHGMLAACMICRRAPTGGWPTATQDIDGAVAWLLHRADLYGGNPARLVVIGHSAGARHVATWLLSDAFRGGAREQLKSAVLMSGFYGALAPVSLGQSASFGNDPSLDASRSPLARVGSICDSPFAVLMTQASNDPDDLRRRLDALAEGFRQHGAAVQTVVLEGHNHASPLMSLGSDDDTVGLMLRRFVSRTTAPTQRLPTHQPPDAVTPSAADAP